MNGGAQSHKKNIRNFESMADAAAVFETLMKLHGGSVIDAFGETRMTVSEWIKLDGVSVSGKPLISSVADMPYHPYFLDLRTPNSDKTLFE